MYTCVRVKLYIERYTCTYLLTSVCACISIPDSLSQHNTVFNESVSKYYTSCCQYSDSSRSILYVHIGWLLDLHMCINIICFSCENRSNCKHQTTRVLLMCARARATKIPYIHKAHKIHVQNIYMGPLSVWCAFTGSHVLIEVVYSCASRCMRFTYVLQS